MRISSSSLVILALSLSTANGAMRLQRQVIHALESVQQSKMASSLTVKKSMMRALETEEDMCFEAFYGSGTPDGGDGGDDGEYYNDNAEDGDGVYYDDVYYNDAYYDDVTPLVLVNAIIEEFSEYCDSSTGILICDLLDATEAVRIGCDAGEKPVTNNILVCKENVPDDDEAAGMDTIIRNWPVCVPQVCPDDTNFLELRFPTFYSNSTGIEGDTETVTNIGIPNRKEECASGTTLPSASVENVSDTGDNSDGMDSDSGNSSAENVSDTGDNGGG
eukprot:CAMPEP_0195518212 /NCGR_PEP_ID=MMETSP0794_2-20130614/12583_1 /TAXON_ID=515487 /ORGANISM="Stephanopyxis turris, Strain CCMP 815" /LENGTH=274 /DNA_ID=CAMNT_0040647139 /DNA_START=56 /DNA_END=877 /DNA_ORIENTATION=-